MKGYFGVFLLVACFLPAFGRISSPSRAEGNSAENLKVSANCALLEAGTSHDKNSWVEINHLHLDGTQHLRVDLDAVIHNREGVIRVGSKLVACDDEGTPELVLSDDKKSILISRTKPGNKHGYIQLTSYIKVLRPFP